MKEFGAASQAVAAVVVTYNRRQLLERCLDSIENQTRRPELIIVIDNASTDDTAAHLAERVWLTDHETVRLPRNYGGAMGFAVGLDLATRTGVASVWLMDDDAVAHPEALEYLLEDYKAATSAGRTPGFACSSVEWRDGTVARMNIPRANAQWNETGLLVDRPIVDVDSASFVSCLVPTDHVRAVGLPHFGYFKWYDDTEYTLRLRGRFGPGVCSQRSVVTHLCASNDGALPWLATDDDLEAHARALRNRVSASLELSDVRGLLSVVRDTVRVAIEPSQPLHRRATLLGGFAKGLAYRPRVQFPSS